MPDEVEFWAEQIRRFGAAKGMLITDLDSEVILLPAVRAKEQ